MRASEFLIEAVAQNQQGVTEGKLNETRDQLWTWVQSKFPRTQWPEYVQRDFLYAKAKGNQNQKDLEDFLDEIQRDFGRVKWQLEKLPITLDIFTPKTQRMIKEREGGSSNPYQVPKDAERHALQQKMIQQKGVSQEPIIVAKLGNGYDLIEGWHRTIQHLKEFPQGYTAPAWVGYGATYTSESIKQGVSEGLEHADKLSGLVDLPVFTSPTNTSGTAKVVNTGDRIMAVLNVRGVNIPYYISTGGGGKASVPTGKWYPIFGRHSSGWLNKGGEDSINKSYGSNALALGSSRLNNMLGDLSSMESQIPFMKKSGDGIINRDLHPMSYAEVSANPDEFKKRVNSFLAKLGSPPFYKVKATEMQGLTEGTLSIDVPNEDWLQDKINYAKSKGRDSYGVPYMGSTTAHVIGSLPRVRVMRLASLPGARHEQTNVRKDDLKSLMDYMEKTGKLPPGRFGDEYPPYIMVAYNGEAWVNEGNHRIMAAYRLNWPDMPIEIRYFDGGERIKDGPMYPGKIGLS